MGLKIAYKKVKAYIGYSAAVNKFDQTLPEQ